MGRFGFQAPPPAPPPAPRRTTGRLWAVAGWPRLRPGMLRRKRHRWIKDALIAIGVALIVVGAYELLSFLGAVLVGGP